MDQNIDWCNRYRTNFDPSVAEMDQCGGFLHTCKDGGIFLFFLIFKPVGWPQKDMSSMESFRFGYPMIAGLSPAQPP